ncbi:hypothetical protein BH11MYX4_BH11MYX4_50250 [soil metagenome]
MLSIKRSMVVACVSALGLASVYACKVDDENPASARRDAGAVTAADALASEGSGPAVAACTRLGGPAVVATIADGILGRVRADCRLSAAFANVPAEGEQHLKECFAIQMQVFFKCPGVAYPANDSQGDACRSLTEAHQDLGLTSSDFQAFVDDALAELATRSLTSDETREVASGLLGTRTGIVAEETPLNAYCTCPGGKFNGKPCTDLDAGFDASDARDAASDG